MPENHEQKCHQPKTKAELAASVAKAFIKFLDKNKAESVIFFIGIAGASIAAFTNPQKIIDLVKLWISF